ncbi:replicative superfamily II helicase [Nonomuraea muscovyensis]|uniref:Replicative superfamily II helicase n=1 Tax=Nonomuraea muscovyensis TaxID=1124761 RepID=A0A7X0CBU6_9ACTN|nr:hypothetical protein [Nonomuraea muscovyensis]MBB6351256.1 replicative superfamily II helicase [Nonomuraea muscovyensis]
MAVAEMIAHRKSDAQEQVDATDSLQILGILYDQISNALQNASDPKSAFARATTLADALREMADDAALTRAKLAARIREDEGLSMQALGQALGISKARAAQLINAAQNG